MFMNLFQDPNSFSSLNFFDEAINWDALSDELENYNWSSEFRSGINTPEMMERFTSVCLDIASNWVPA